MSTSRCPSVSVVIPVFNAGATLEPCIESLLNLVYPRENRELILVNNGSTDHSVEVLNRYASEIRVVFEAQRGAAAARNAGIRQADGEFIAFTDADCLVDAQWLHSLVTILHDRPAGMVGGAIRAARPCNAIAEFGEKIHNQERAINEFRPQYVASANMAARRSELFEIGLFDPGFLRGQDSDLAYRIQQHGWEIVYAPEAIVYHRNQSTLRGLFKEGYTHGLGSVLLHKKHRVFLAEYNYRRFSPHGYRQLYRTLKSCFNGSDRLHAKCDLIFNIGKKFGKYAGSLRFLYPDI